MRYKWAIVLLLSLAGWTPLAAQQGTIVGQVVDRSTSEPLAGAQVFVVGTTRGALANQDGRFIIQQVPAGQQEVRATLIGYSSQAQQVTVTAGGTATTAFQLSQSAIELGAVVVSATGSAQTKREIGSSVGVINVEQVDLAPVSTFSDLLQGRSAGTIVTQSSGTTGAGSRIRIRGSNSISLSNSPLLVIDGVRVENSPASLGLGVGGQSPSRLDDLNPENIESIDILKGPAASALYGTAAANGVIQITTKRGRAGSPQFRAWGEYGTLESAVTFPDNVVAVNDAGTVCTLFRQAAGTCIPTETHRFNPLENATTTPFDGGSREVFGGSVSGGGEDATFFLSAERMNEDGIYLRDNWLERTTLQANLSGRLSEQLRVRGTVGFVESDLALPFGDNALFGIVPMGLFGVPTPTNVENNDGFESDPQFHYDWKTLQAQSRFTGSAAADFEPVSWLRFNGSAGLERLTREEQQRVPRDNAYSIFGGVYTNGWIQVYDYDIYNINTNLSGAAIFDVTPELISTTTLGTQYLRENFHRIYSFGAGLIPGIETSLAGATSDFSAWEQNILNATLSAYAQEQLAWRDRVFVNAAVRGDKNTAFGTDIGWIWYPSISSSWVVSEEEFFPQLDFVSQLRLRAAYGQAGLRPGATDALLSFGGATGAFQNQNVAAIIISDIGNPDLRPERSSEWEFGFETGLFDDRFGLELTYFTKTSEDALVNRPLPTSPGGSGTRWENLGEVNNRGLEMMLSGNVLRSQNVDWNFSISGSRIQNELIDLGEDAEGEPNPPIGSGVQRFVEGYPLGGWWERPIYSYEDSDGDGLLELSDVVIGVEDADGNVQSDSVAFFGNALPTREASFSTDVSLFRWLRMGALLDYKGGHKQLNYTRAWRCARKYNCADTFDQNLSLEEQAGIIAYARDRSYAGFFEDADFVKLREVSLSVNIPTEWVNRFQADNVRLTLAGRNLATWTGYTGFDPEVAWQGAANFTAGDFATLPSNRMLTLRVDANF